MEILLQKFPELNDSEDERTRKEIIDWMKGGNTYEWQDNKDRWIAYLERQKEQKPAEWNNTDMKEARDNLISVCRDWERGMRVTLLPTVATRARCFLEHLSEPQPAGWSEEQPDNEDIDKVAQELYEHLYELKRRNNVPTNLYDKQEIIALWKAGIEYAYNHPKQEQPMPDSTKLIELWHEDKEMLKEKDFRDDPWRLAYNAFMCGFGRGIAVNKPEQPDVDLEKAARYVYESWMGGTMDDVRRDMVELGKVLNARKEE